MAWRRSRSSSPGIAGPFRTRRSTVEDQVAEGDKVTTRWRARGTNSDGAAFTMNGITIERIAAGKIVELWVARDELGLMRQLGAL